MCLARNASYRLSARSCARLLKALVPVSEGPCETSDNSATAAGLTYRASSLNWVSAQTQSGQPTAMVVTVAGRNAGPGTMRVPIAALPSAGTRLRYAATNHVPTDWPSRAEMLGVDSA